ncbi:hypothetical protein DRF65_23625 [Chryseobacterium pennae]|uniref:Outer membrane protein beta-barrel domain-containing protein n=1 Tax=Chryseobacterium pennae TaxID=2258962 RepID=A0A3D9C2Y6_9FLAO|nr:hypothetical protein [Chryseobacterium pennae]REC59902.1 hypothetical protein DRF65_23625 [Chryseobacterium pennae]
MLKDKYTTIMFFKKSFLIIFLIILQTFNAQRKKTDTLYVYEKVIIYDTIYLEKALKIQPKGIILNETTATAGKDPIQQFTFFRDQVKGIPISVTKKIQFGIEIGTGIKNSNWAKELGKNNTQFGINAGLWISKPIINKLSLMFSAHVYHWNSNFDLDARKEDTWLNGYYFTKDSQPLLFQQFNNKHFEYALQLKLLYEWRNFKPFIGILTHKNIYKMKFLTPENNILNKPDDFTSNQLNFGYSMGIQYKALKKWILSVDYQEYKMNNVSLKNSTYNFDIFQTNNTFAERKINFGISYIISG